jgi:hypothetical protein
MKTGNYSSSSKVLEKIGGKIYAEPLWSKLAKHCMKLKENKLERPKLKKAKAHDGYWGCIGCFSTMVRH